jgi:hypothetical protein
VTFPSLANSPKNGRNDQITDSTDSHTRNVQFKEDTAAKFFIASDDRIVKTVDCMRDLRLSQLDP